MRVPTLTVALLMCSPAVVLAASDDYDECVFLRIYRQAVLDKVLPALPTFPGASSCKSTGEGYRCEWRRSVVSTQARFDYLVETIPYCLADVEVLYDEEVAGAAYVYDDWVQFYLDTSSGRLTMTVSRWQ